MPGFADFYVCAVWSRAGWRVGARSCNGRYVDAGHIRHGNGSGAARLDAIARRRLRYGVGTRLSAGTHVDDFAGWLVSDGARRDLPRLQPAGRPTRCGQGRVGDHLQDSTHTSFGVVTTGLVISRFKLEGSVFNGREPNEERWSIQLNPLDSWSARVSAAPSGNWTAQYSYGLLLHSEALEPMGDERRQTSSIEYNRPLARGNWASTVVWGRKRKIPENTVLNSYLFESTLNFLDRNYFYTRLGTGRQR